MCRRLLEWACNPPNIFFSFNREYRSPPACGAARKANVDRFATCRRTDDVLDLELKVFIAVNAFFIVDTGVKDRLKRFGDDLKKLRLTSPVRSDKAEWFEWFRLGQRSSQADIKPVEEPAAGRCLDDVNAGEFHGRTLTSCIALAFLSKICRTIGLGSWSRSKSAVFRDS